MLNNVQLMGRIAQDLELKKAGDNNYIRFTLCVDSDFKGSDGEYRTDFINCIAWNSTAEFINSYFKKGGLICVLGRISTGNYENKDGQTVYTTDIIIKQAYFTGERKSDTDAEDNRNSKKTAYKKSYYKR